MRGIHHLGVAVADLDEAVDDATSGCSAASSRRARRCRRRASRRLRCSSATSRVELLAPTGDDTPVGRFLARAGPGMHHVAYEVDDIAAELERLGGDGVGAVDSEPRAGCTGSQVAFLHPGAVHGVLTELVSRG